MQTNFSAGTAGCFHGEIATVDLAAYSITVINVINNKFRRFAPAEMLTLKLPSPKVVLAFEPYTLTGREGGWPVRFVGTLDTNGVWKVSQFEVLANRHLTAPTP